MRTKVKSKLEAVRVPCVGGCGSMVLKTIGECRKCRRSRVVAGKRRTTKILPKSHAVPKLETSKQKFHRVKGTS